MKMMGRTGATASLGKYVACSLTIGLGCSQFAHAQQPEQVSIGTDNPPRIARTLAACPYFRPFPRLPGSGGAEEQTHLRGQKGQARLLTDRGGDVRFWGCYVPHVLRQEFFCRKVP